MNIIQQDFHDVFKHVITTFLHIEHIDKVYKSCKTLKAMIDYEWKMIYHDCLHHQPHNPGKHDEPVIDEYGDQHWYKEGLIHRDGDQPAEIWADGSQLWFIEDKKHRDGDQAAIIWADSTQEWYREGKLHRDGNLPAVIWADGYQEWYKDGLLNRDNGKPVVIDDLGTQQCVKNGICY